jgi:hypothetical protein
VIAKIRCRLFATVMAGIISSGIRVVLWQHAAVVAM